MPFDESKNKHTLFIQDFSGRKGTKYKLHMMMQIMTPDGNIYSHPLPMDTTALASIKFDEIKFVPPIGVNRVDPGEMQLNSYASDYNISKRTA